MNKINKFFSFIGDNLYIIMYYGVLSYMTSIYTNKFIIFGFKDFVSIIAMLLLIYGLQWILKVKIGKNDNFDKFLYLIFSALIGLIIILIISAIFILCLNGLEAKYLDQHLIFNFSWENISIWTLVLIFPFVSEFTDNIVNVWKSNKFLKNIFFICFGLISSFFVVNLSFHYSQVSDVVIANDVKEINKFTLMKNLNLTSFKSTLDHDDHLLVEDNKLLYEVQGQLDKDAGTRLKKELDSYKLNKKYENVVTSENIKSISDENLNFEQLSYDKISKTNMEKNDTFFDFIKNKGILIVLVLVSIFVLPIVVAYSYTILKYNREKNQNKLSDENYMLFSLYSNLIVFPITLVCHLIWIWFVLSHSLNYFLVFGIESILVVYWLVVMYFTMNKWREYLQENTIKFGSDEFNKVIEIVQSIVDDKGNFSSTRNIKKQMELVPNLTEYNVDSFWYYQLNMFDCATWNDSNKNRSKAFIDYHINGVKLNRKSLQNSVYAFYNVDTDYSKKLVTDFKHELDHNKSKVTVIEEKFDS